MKKEIPAISKLHPGTKRLVNPHTYPAGLKQGLHKERERLLADYRKTGGKSVP